MLGLIEELAFDRVGAFTYSEEDGTPAASMSGKVPESLMRERMEQLMDLQRDIAAERSASLVGTEMLALVDEVLHDDPEFGAVARTVSQAVDVDGVTHLYPHEGVRQGQMVRVRIEDSMEYDFVGRVVG